MDAHSFLQQQRTFAVHGYALNPSAVSTDPSSTYVGDADSAAANKFAMIENIKGTHGSRRENKRKRQGKGDAGVVDGEGAYLGPWAGWEGEKEEGVEELEEDAEEWRAEKRRREEAQEATREKMKKAGEEKSIFHGQSFYSRFGVASARGTHVIGCYRKISYRLRWEDVYAHPDRSGNQPQTGRGYPGRGEFHPSDVHAYLDWPYEGCIRYPAVPQEWPSLVEC